MGYATVKIIVKDGRVDRVFADWPVNVEVINLDTQDEDELTELQELVTDCEENYIEVH